jgi:hypothetical protein
MNTAARPQRSKDLAWFKSSYSGDEGGDCLEVAYDWHKSSYSTDQGGACLEIAYAWCKSTYSGSEGGDCLEVALHPAAVHIRDSKVPSGPILTVDRDTWAAFVRSVG